MELRLRFSCLAASSIAVGARIGRSANLWSTRARARASSHCGCATSCECDQFWLVLAMGANGNDAKQSPGSRLHRRPFKSRIAVSPDSHCPTSYCQGSQTA
jgi:hypothetical protein